MGRIIIALIVAASVYFGYRHVSAASAAATLRTVPTGSGIAFEGGAREVAPSGPLAGMRVPRRHTVFIFTAGWCPACHQLEEYLPGFCARRPDVAIRMIAMDTPAQSEHAMTATGLNVRGIPHVVIYNADGQLVASDSSGSRDGTETLVHWIEDEMNRR